MTGRIIFILNTDDPGDSLPLGNKKRHSFKKSHDIYVGRNKLQRAVNPLAPGTEDEPWSTEQLSTRADSSVILCRAMFVPSVEPCRPRPGRGRMLGTRRHHPHIPTGQRGGLTYFSSPRPRGDGLYGCSNGACEMSWRGDSRVLRDKCLPPSTPLTASSSAPSQLWGVPHHLGCCYLRWAPGSCSVGLPKICLLACSTKTDPSGAGECMCRCSGFEFSTWRLPNLLRGAGQVSLSCTLFSDTDLLSPPSVLLSKTGQSHWEKKQNRTK